MSFDPLTEPPEAPQRFDADFSDKADAFVAWLAQDFYPELDSFITALNGYGYPAWPVEQITGVLQIDNGGTGSGTQSGARQSLGLEIGVDVADADGDLLDISISPTNISPASSELGDFLTAIDEAIGTLDQGVTDAGMGFAPGATWQDEIGSRSINTTYQNTTDYFLGISIYSYGDGTRNLEVSADGSTSWMVVGRIQGNDVVRSSFTAVPPGWYYRVDQTGGGGYTIANWLELKA